MATYKSNYYRYDGTAWHKYYFPTLADMVTEDATHRFVTDTEKTTWNSKQNALGYTPLNKAGDTMTGRLVLHNAYDSNKSPLNIPNYGTTDPITLANGDIWHRSNVLYARLNGTSYALATTSDIYQVSVSRTMNTVLAAPNGANGTATFRALVEADIPSLAQSKITGLDTSLAAKAAKEQGVYYVEGNTTGTAGTWTGSISGLSAYYDGLTIRFRIGIGGAATTTLNINSLGAVTVQRYVGSGNVTTHFAVNSVITITKVGSSWVVQDWYDSTDDYSMRWINNVTAGVQITRYKIIMEGVNGKYYPLTINDSTAENGKVVSTQEFLLGGLILQYNSTATTVNADAVFGSYYLWSQQYTGVSNYTFNKVSGWIAGLPLYLKGTIQSNNTFKLDNTTAQSWLTQALPTTDDGFVYIKLGYMHNTTTAYTLTIDHTIYHYKNGRIRLYETNDERPASDVSAWAKAAEKPTYTASEVSALASDHDASAVTAAKIANWDAAYTHGTSVHAPSDATAAGATGDAHAGTSHAYLPLAGGTLTGILHFNQGLENAITFAGNEISINGTGNNKIYKIGTVAVATGYSHQVYIGTGVGGDGTQVYIGATTGTFTTTINGVLQVASVKTAGNFYLGTTAPTNTNRLNYDGYFYAKKLYSENTEVSIAGHTHAYVPTDRTVNDKALSANIVLRGGDIVKAGTTATGASTAGKSVTISGYTLTAGDILAITFTNGNTANSPTISINMTSAKNIRMNGANVTTTTFTLAAGTVVMLYYDGTYFQAMGSQRTVDTDTNTTYAVIPTSEIDEGTATTLRTLSGVTAKYIIDKAANALKRTSLSYTGGETKTFTAEADTKAIMFSVLTGSGYFDNKIIPFQSGDTGNAYYLDEGGFRVSYNFSTRVVSVEDIVVAYSTVVCTELRG